MPSCQIPYYAFRVLRKRHIHVLLVALVVASSVNSCGHYQPRHKLSHKHTPRKEIAKPESHHLLVGEASWYGKAFAGRKTASGERFNYYKLTAAHKTLPFGTLVEVTNLSNGRSVIVKINDRGPFIKGRIIDMSKAAAQQIGMVRSGKAMVEIKPLSL